MLTNQIQLVFDKKWWITIWDKVSIKKRVDSESVYNKKYLTTKIKSYEGKISTNFHGDKIPKEGSQYICLSVVLTDSIFKVKTIILKYFQKNVNILLKKKRWLNMLLMIKKFLLMINILIRRITIKNKFIFCKSNFKNFIFGEAILRKSFLNEKF